MSVSKLDKELQPLIEGKKVSASSLKTSARKATQTVKIINAPLKGASNFSTFSLIAIVYEEKGLWIIAPMTAGAAITLTHESLAVLVEKYPDIKFFKTLQNGTFFLQNGVGAFLGDFGFAWSTLISVAGFVGGVEYKSNWFAEYAAPGIAGILAAFKTGVAYEYLNKGTPVERSLKRHIAESLKGMSATGVLSVLSQQNVIPSNIPISLVAVLGVSLLSTLASLAQESQPKLAKAVKLIIEMVILNPSLASVLFHLPLDIYAAEHNHTVSNGFFYGVVSVTGVFLTLLTTVSLMNLLAEREKAAEDLEASKIEAVVEDPKQDDYDDEIVVDKTAAQSKEEIVVEKDLMQEKKKTTNQLLSTISNFKMGLFGGGKDNTPVTKTEASLSNTIN